MASIRLFFPAILLCDRTVTHDEFAALRTIGHQKGRVIAEQPAIHGESCRAAGWKSRLSISPHSSKDDRLAKDFVTRGVFLLSYMQIVKHANRVTMAPPANIPRRFPQVARPLR